MTDQILQAEALAFKKSQCTNLLRDGILQTDDLEDGAAELSAISKTVEANVNAYVAVESYMRGFMDTVSNENWTRERATQYHRGMSGILKTMGIGIDPGFAMASFEAVSVTQTKEENRNESKAKGTGLLKRIIEAIKAAITKFIELAKNFNKRVGDSGRSIVTASETLKAKVSAVEGSPDTSVALSGSWGNYLLVGTTSVVPAKAVDSVRVNAVLAAEIWIEAYDIAAKAVGAQASRNSAIPSSAVWSGLNDLKNMQKPWPGGVTMALEGVAEGTPTIEMMTKSKIKLTAGAAPTPTLVTLDKNTCNSVVMSIKSLGDAVVKSEGLLNKLTADMKAIQSSLPNPADDAEVPPAVKALPSLISAAMSGPQVLYPYAAKVAKGAYRHVEESLKNYK